MPKPLAQGQTRPDPLPPELIEKAKTLLEEGTAEQQALAKIALKQHDEADRIIQELKSKPGNPLDEAFRLLTLEGDNWYQAGEFDKAIEPYEKALALRPEDVQARRNACRRQFCPLGKHRRPSAAGDRTGGGDAQARRPRIPRAMARCAGKMPTGDRGPKTSARRSPATKRR